MEAKITASNMISCVFGIVVLTIGILNVVLVHPTPGVIYFLLSFIYFPPANAILKKRFGYSITYVKIILGMIIIWFTLGISDLGDMID
jgi:hypothetical protein